MTMNESKSAQESSLELKYCERCGALWLRPAGGGQIYCASCARALGEMPPATYQRDSGRKPQMPQGPRWAASERDGDSYEQYDNFDVDAAGGVA
jgi:hypothetical protein